MALFKMAGLRRSHVVSVFGAFFKFYFYLTGFSVTY